ncbi:DUF6069 family protein [Nocardia sp. NPDC005978]|uniref:DUF6069 family protein n=1 Tax=Nocardia sp. NPDC005978 TaxID=3156725 RepID=UPI0033AEA1BC
MTTAATNSVRKVSIPALSRPVAVLSAIAGAVVANMIVWLLGMAAGGSFETTTDGKVQSVAPGGILMLTVVPLLIGLTAAALLSYKWPGILRVAAVIGSVLAVGTIALTVAADFDTASTVALAVTHLTLVPALVFATEAMRRKLIR